jgi:hypothetical protein
MSETIAQITEDQKETNNDVIDSASQAEDAHK